MNTMAFDKKSQSINPTFPVVFYATLYVLLLLSGFTTGAYANTSCLGSNCYPQTQTKIVQVRAELIFTDSFEFFVVPLSAPINLFNIGDSIGEGEAADNVIGSANHETVWSTGFNPGDDVNAINERFELMDTSTYNENSASRDSVINQAVSGSVMADFADQAQAVADGVSSLPDDAVGMVSVLLGSNDVCADTLEDMTDPELFETQYRAGLDVLASPTFNDTVNVHISSIPDIYWLWDAKRDDFICKNVIWPFVPCGNLLDGPSDDCANDASREDPDAIDPDDGPNCQRRKAVHAEIRDTYNPILEDVLAEYQSNNQLFNAEYVDIFDVKFSSTHVNSGDCFHPSEAGQALLAEKSWCSSKWGQADQACSQ